MTRLLLTAPTVSPLEFVEVYNSLRPLSTARQGDSKALLPSLRGGDLNFSSRSPLCFAVPSIHGLTLIRPTALTFAVLGASFTPGTDMVARATQSCFRPSRCASMLIIS